MYPLRPKRLGYARWFLLLLLLLLFLVYNMEEEEEEPPLPTYLGLQLPILLLLRAGCLWTGHMPI